MGGSGKKIRVGHDTRNKFGLPPEPNELQHRFASLMGFPFLEDSTALAAVAEDDDGLIGSDDEA